MFHLLSVFTPPPGIFPVPHWAAITDREDRLTMEDGVPRRDFWGTYWDPPVQHLWGTYTNPIEAA